MGSRGWLVSLCPSELRAMKSLRLSTDIDSQSFLANIEVRCLFKSQHALTLPRVAYTDDWKLWPLISNPDYDVLLLPQVDVSIVQAVWAAFIPANVKLDIHVASSKTRVEHQAYRLLEALDISVDAVCRSKQSIL